MATLPDPELVAHMAAHAELCDKGARFCRDCLAFRDEVTLTAVTIARIEFALIDPWIRANHGICVYCGDWSAHRDHLVPRPWTGPEVRKFVPTVPACADCNLRISDAHVFTVAGRAAVAAKSLRKRHSKALKTRDDGDDDTAGMSPRFASQIKRRRNYVRMVRRRLIALDAGGASCVGRDVWIAA